ncbi:MAG: hypothetical protein P3W91_000750 [Fervidobacterium sp.]|nr:hypothetical protein [Fervidobacterium sp.]
MAKKAETENKIKVSVSTKTVERRFRAGLEFTKAEKVVEVDKETYEKLLSDTELNVEIVE